MRKRIATILVLALVLSSCNKTEVLETTVTEKTTELTTCEETTVEPTSVFKTEETYDSDVREGSFGERLLSLQNVTRVEELEVDHEWEDEEEEPWDEPLRAREDAAPASVFGAFVGSFSGVLAICNPILIQKWFCF